MLFIPTHPFQDTNQCILKQRHTQKKKCLSHQLPPSLLVLPTPQHPLANPPLSIPTKSCLFPCCHPLLRPPTAQVTCPKGSWQNYSEANKDTNGRSRQPALASAFITSRFHDTLKLLMEPPWRAYDGASRCRHIGLQGSRLPRFRQSEVSNEYTCVVCSKGDTGRNRAREEDEYWVNVLSRIELHSQFPSHSVLCC